MTLCWKSSNWYTSTNMVKTLQYVQKGFFGSGQRSSSDFGWFSFRRIWEVCHEDTPNILVCLNASCLPAGRTWVGLVSCSILSVPSGIRGCWLVVLCQVEVLTGIFSAVGKEEMSSEKVFHTVDYYNEDRDTAVGLRWSNCPDKECVCVYSVCTWGISVLSFCVKRINLTHIRHTILIGQ